ncbi:hypothetical protein B1A_05462 [mine drainage metagenome]|uniref:Uncharacterized protein n=1 Tax=mine drainage metagenome TaxID=410659 RepID=T1CU74_9ZZZZ
MGTVTEGSVAPALQWGRIASPWWAFSPEEDMYADEPVPAPPPLLRNSRPEIFAFFGMRAKLRFYNAFAQGQFRHSDLRVPPADLHVLFGKAWTGIEYRTSGLEIRYLVRFASPEFSAGIGSRSLLWGNIEFDTSFGGR